MKETRRLLIMSTLGVGDILLAQPLLHEIRTASGYEYICILARRGPPAALVRRLGVADEICEYHSATKYRLRHAAEIGRWLRTRRCDAALTTTGMNPMYTAIMALASGAPIRIGERRGKIHRVWTMAIPVVNRTHVVVRNRNIGRALGVEPGLVPRISLEDNERERARSLIPGSRRLVAVIPGSNKDLTHKRWPVPHFRTLVRALIDNGIHPVLLGGPDEQSLGSEISSGIPGNKLTDLVGRTDLGTAAAVLSLCTIAVGNDGMLMHFAAAVETRTISLFGPTDPDVYRPMGTCHTVIQSPISCAPCYHLDTRGCINPRCMTILSPHIVIDKTISMVGGTGERP